MLVALSGVEAVGDDHLRRRVYRRVWAGILRELSNDIGQIRRVVSAALGAIGTIVLFFNSYTLEPLGMRHSAQC